MIIAILCNFPLLGEEVNVAHGNKDTVITISRFGFGGRLGASSILHSAAFSHLQGIPSCCPEFSKAQSQSPTIGLDILYRFSDIHSLSMRVGLLGLGGDFSYDQKQYVMAPQNEITINHSLNTSITALALEPMYAVSIGKLGIGIGPFIALPMKAQFEQKETVFPGTFSNGSRIRNEYSGDIPGISMVWGLTGAIQYHVPMNALGNIKLIPELSITKTLNEFSPSTAWTALLGRVGIGILWSPINIQYPSEEVPVQIPVQKIIPPLLTDIQILEYSEKESKQVESVDSIEITEIIMEELQPLLPYVFFEEMSDTISQRYSQLQHSEVDVFSEQSLMSLDVIERYHHTLNILGKRLQQNPTLLVKLTGCTSSGSERLSKDLGKKRAEAIAAYLRNIWTIESNRITVIGRELPENPSNNQYKEGQEENRRVEIECSNPMAFEILKISDTQRRITPSAVTLQGKVLSGTGIAQWRMSVIEDTAILLYESNGRDESRVSLIWKPLIHTLQANHDTLTMRYNVVDSLGRTSTSYKAIPYHYKRLKKNEKGISYAGKEKNIKYSLILFDFDKADLNERNLRILAEIRNNVKGGTISIVGATDIHGNPERNELLSLQRARAVATYLGINPESVKGNSAFEEYPNTLPEGRFYNRTVIVDINQ